MRPPLPPNFSNMRARVEEHNRMMQEEARTWGLPLTAICPDCYAPEAFCIHRPAKGTDPIADEFGRFD